MASAKVSKGCYNCMVRRIKCDKTEPGCQKCMKKELECPGYGVRYRFNEGIAARGKLRKKSINFPSQAVFLPCQPQHSNSNSTLKLTWVGDPLEEKTDENPIPETSCNDHEVSEQTNEAVLDDTSQCRVEVINADEFDYVVEVNRYSQGSESSGQTPSLQPCLELVDARTRQFFTYFAELVSPVMTLVDDKSNGYRHIILPIAVSNPMVRRAVCVASTFHMSVQRPELGVIAERGKAAIIRKLRETATASKHYSIDTWATILLLLVAELVNGSEEILNLYQLLASFLQVKDSTQTDSATALFLQHQTNLLEFFAVPVLDEVNGAQRLIKECSPILLGLEWPESLILTQEVYNEAYQQACDIYVLRASCQFIDITNEQSTKLVTHLRDLVIDVDPNGAGAHTLVWPYFVGAAEAVLEEHREFFLGRLEHIWITTQYRNVKVAMDALPRIWAERGRQRWTKMLREVAMVIM